jgi:hypothetical protein
MAFQQIPVNAPFLSNAEDESKVTFAEQRMDVIKDLLGSTIRRPALIPFVGGLPGKVVGQYYWEITDMVYFVSDRSLFSMSENKVITEIGANLYGPGEDVSWDESANLELVTAGAVRKLFSANSERIVEYDGSTAQKLEGTNDPVKSSHIIMFDTYLLSNELNGQKYDESILHSKVADPINFEGAFFSAENKPDPIKAMHTDFDEIALFGSKTMENFYDNGVDPFVAIPGGQVKQGTLSPWSIKSIDNAWFFLNADRRLVRVDGRQGRVLSQPIDDILTDSADAENARGEEVTINGKTLYLLTINERTFVFDYAQNEWVGEWASWNSTTATYKKFKARNFINIKQWGKTLCSDVDTGTIYELSDNDYQDDGETIRSSVITGHFDHGTSRGKRVNELRLRLKRGKVARVTVDDPEPLLLVRWQNDGDGDWSNYRSIPLGFQGDTKFSYSLFQMGSYYNTRQYQFVCTDDTPFSIVKAEEDLEFLR